jgi:hypothetical protein
VGTLAGRASGLGIRVTHTCRGGQHRVISGLGGLGKRRRALNQGVSHIGSERDHYGQRANQYKATLHLIPPLESEDSPQPKLDLACDAVYIATEEVYNKTAPLSN